MITTLGTIDELKFDEKNHTYKLHGLELPSVTALMAPLSDDLYADIPEDVLAKAAGRGTAVHDAIEMYNKFGILHNLFELLVTKGCADRKGIIFFLLPFPHLCVSVHFYIFSFLLMA